MKLFENEADPAQNLLPREGIVHYYGPVIAPEQAASYLEALLHTISWRSDEAVIFGRKIVTRREVAWYGDQPYRYTYSNITRQALPWTGMLLELKRYAEMLSGETFNSCLLNLYHDGTGGMGWHSDAETDLKKDAAIASMSFGAERAFDFRHKQTKEKIRLWLEPGSLLVMKGSTQRHWQHCVPVSARVKQPRVNLTFRTIVETGG